MITINRYKAIDLFLNIFLRFQMLYIVSLQKPRKLIILSKHT